MRDLRPMCRAAVAVTAALALSACTDDGRETTRGGAAPTAPAAAPTSASASAAAPHGSADVAFAQGMIPHHQQAVEMATLAETRASDPEVKALALKIKQAQEPEIQQLSAWLSEWGAAAPSPTPSGSASASASAGGHSGHDENDGMMTEQELHDLQATSGAEFDDMFLDMMIRHHEGAVEMARTEQQEGQHQPAKDLARQIETSQSEEIAKMRALLGTE